MVTTTSNINNSISKGKTPMKKKTSSKGKMTLKKWENSAMDDKADKAGTHGKEGSKKDMAADKKAVKALNKKKKK